jgi:hypothetical protein
MVLSMPERADGMQNIIELAIKIDSGSLAHFDWVTTANLQGNPSLFFS